MAVTPERETLSSFAHWPDDAVKRSIENYRAVKRGDLTMQDRLRFGALLQEAHRRRLTGMSATQDDLRAAFDEWVNQHAYIWFDGDLRLAGALASFLGIQLEIDGLAVAEDNIEGVTQG